MRLPPKKDVALALLERSTIFLHLDPRDEGVRVPPWFKKQAQLVLQVGLNMAVPIHDLSVDDHGVSCTLSFSRSPHYCVIPWKAVYALVGEDGRGMVWPDDVPPEVAAQAQQQARPAKERAHLRAVPEQAATADSDTAAQPARRAAAAGGRSRGGAAAEEAKAKAEPGASPKKPRRRKAKAGATSDAEPARKSPRGATKTAQKTGKVQPVPDPPAAEQPPASSKPKRELPPYLRIVK